MTNTLYFAYGSNLFVTQITNRCPDLKYVKKVSLSGYRLTFSTYAHLEKTNNPDDIVEGVLYSLTEQDEQRLDIYEGVHSGCYSKVYLIEEDQKIMTYINNRGIDKDPTKKYLDKIIAGYNFWGFDSKSLCKLRLRCE